MELINEGPINHARVVLASLGNTDPLYLLKHYHISKYAETLRLNVSMEINIVTYMGIAQSLLKCSSLGADSVDSTCLFVNASVVKNTHCLAISIKIKFKEKFKVGVEHEVFFTFTWVNSLPLPVLPSILVYKNLKN